MGAGFETWVRTHRPRAQMEGLLEYREDVGWIHRPGGQFLHVGWGDSYEFVNRVVINSAGFRDVERTATKPAASLRIAVLGDSMVEALQVPQDEVFAQIMERRLGEMLVRPVEVLNFGVTGYGTDQQFLVYRHYARAYQPDIVVLCFFSRNDVFNNSRELETGFPVTPMVKKPFARLGSDGLTWSSFDVAAVREFDRTRQAQRDAYLRTWKGSLRRVCRSCDWARDVLAAGTSDGPSMEPQRSIYAADPDAQIRAAWDLTTAIFRELVDSVRADGARLVLIGMPCPWELELEQRLRSDGAAATTEDPRRPERVVRAFCEANGVPFRNLLDDFVECETDGGPLFWAVDGHLTKRGHQVVADALIRFLQQCAAL